jgi:hypothetical protein
MAAHVPLMVEGRMHIEFWWESQKERDHYGGLEVGGSIILKWISEIKGFVLCIGFFLFRIGKVRRLF